MKLQAVVTGDIVNSTRLEPAREKKLVKQLQGILAPYLFQFYRGDSFQAFQKDAGGALKTALVCRCAAISLAQEKKADANDLRISIGIGRVLTPVRSLNTAKGEPFLLSGRAFDEMVKSGKRLGISVAQPLAQAGLEVLADYIDSIFREMTAKQARVIFELLNGHTQQEIAGKLRKSVSTINQRVSSGRWTEIKSLLEQYQNIINQLLCLSNPSG